MKSLGFDAVSLAIQTFFSNSLGSVCVSDNDLVPVLGSPFSIEIFELFETGECIPVSVMEAL